jgi:hypothetical protein
MLLAASFGEIVASLIAGDSLPTPIGHLAPERFQ